MLSYSSRVHLSYSLARAKLLLLGFILGYSLARVHAKLLFARVHAKLLSCSGSY